MNRRRLRLTSESSSLCPINTIVCDNVRFMATASKAPRTLGIGAAGEAPAIGGRVHALREAMGLSLRDLGERSGVSAPMLSQVERGETSPTLAVAGKIAAGLELTLFSCLGWKEGG